jgi:MoxR-like ATPase
MEPEPMRAVEVVRLIRDEPARTPADKSPDEILAYYHRAVQAAREDARAREEAHPRTLRGS